MCIRDRDTTAAASGDKTTLKWSVWDISSTTYYQPLIDEFEKAHPDVTIEMVDLGSTDYQTVLATELTGNGSDFDVVTVKDVPGYMTLVNKGVLEPLDSYISDSGVDQMCIRDRIHTGKTVDGTVAVAVGGEDLHHVFLSVGEKGER